MASQADVRFADIEHLLQSGGGGFSITVQEPVFDGFDAYGGFKWTPTTLVLRRRLCIDGYEFDPDARWRFAKKATKKGDVQVFGWRDSSRKVTDALREKYYASGRFGSQGSLPMEILLEIIAFSPMETMGTFACCCKSLRALTCERYPAYAKTIGKGYPSHRARKAMNVLSMARQMGIDLEVYLMTDGETFYGVPEHVPSAKHLLSQLGLAKCASIAHKILRQQK